MVHDQQQWMRNAFGSWWKILPITLARSPGCWRCLLSVLRGDLHNVEKCRPSRFAPRGSRKCPIRQRTVSGISWPNRLHPRKERSSWKTAKSNGYAFINVHFTIAMTRLAAHDRDGAIEHLQKCTSKTAIDNLSYEMARVLLVRMKGDPTWPSWLQDDVDDQVNSPQIEAQDSD